jgi:putative flippase GtrA
MDHHERMISQQASANAGQVGKFVVVGVVNTALGYGVFAALWYFLEAYWHPLAVLTLTYALVASFAFILHRTFVFLGTNPLAQSARRYVVVSLTSLAINSFLLQLLTAVWALEVLFGQAVSLFVSAMLTFLLHRFWTFSAGTDQSCDQR